MIPVFQQIVANDGLGDCLRACVASLLELPLEAVPHFTRDQVEGGKYWVTAMREFLESKGYTLGKGNIDELRAAGLHAELLNSGVDGYYIGEVDSANFANTVHCVVFRGLDLAHDPTTGKKWQGTGKDARRYYAIQKAQEEVSASGHEGK